MKSDSEFYDELETIAEKIICELSDSSAKKTSKKNKESALELAKQIKAAVESQRPSHINETTVSLVQFWSKTFGRKDSKVGPKRADLVLSALRNGFTIDDLEAAIKGCALSDWHRENGQIWLTIILRDEDQIEKFIEIYNQNH